MEASWGQSGRGKDTGVRDREMEGRGMRTNYRKTVFANASREPVSRKLIK